MRSLKKTNLLISTSRREFLTFSSMSMLSLAASSVFPKPLKAAMLLETGNTEKLQRESLEELDSLSLYVTSSSAVPGMDTVTFDEPTDEARYLSQVIFQELMKYKFQYDHGVLAGNLGLIPNQGLIDNWEVQQIFRLHENYFSEHLSEYISAMLQSAYRTDTSLTIAERLPSNTWDMVKANKAIDLAEKGEEFRRITDKLYIAAARMLTNNPGAEALRRYTYPDARWAHELKNYYEDNNNLERLIAEIKVEEDSLASLLNAKLKIDGIVNKISVLNAAAEHGHVSQGELEELEQRIFGLVFTGIAQSMTWGNVRDADSVLGRDGSFNDVVEYLCNTQYCGSEVISDHWNKFFSSTQPQAFWSTLSTLGLDDLSLRDPVAHQKILDRYPELAAPNRGAESLFISGLALLLGISHFAWATANDRDEYTAAIDLIQLGVGFSSDGLTVLYESMLTQVARQMLGSSAGQTATSSANASKFSQFMNRLRTKGRIFNNKERLRAEKLFKGNRIAKFIDKVTPWLAGIAVLAAVWGLGAAIASGEGILFASLNLLVATLSFTAVIFAWAAPIAAAIAIFGLLLFIAEWIYNLFQPAPPPPNYVRDFTNNVMQPKQLILPQIGTFVCRTSWGQGVKASPFNVTDMNYDWSTLPSQTATSYTELKALITAKNGNIYNFADIRNPRKGNARNFFSQGTPNSIPNWIIPYQFSGRCTHVAESVDSLGRTKAMFAASKTYDYVYPSLHLSDNLETPPSADVISGYDSEREIIYDIVGINDLDECTFIIFTRYHIYQFTPSRGLIRVSEWYNEDASQISNGGISQLSAFGDKNSIYFFYQTNLDDVSTVYHHVLKPDSSGLFNIMHLVRTTNSVMVEGTTPISTYNGFAGIHIGSGSDARMVGVAASVNCLTRFGMMLGDINGNEEFAGYNDVAFKLSNSVFQGFYKNAFIPA